MLTYPEISQTTWDDLLAHDWGGYTPPLTVHLPIQPVHSPDFVHVDCALNAMRRRVYPRVSSREPERIREIQKLPTFIVQFALDDPPFVPDLHRTRLSLAEGRFPVAQAEYFAWDLLYRFEYACIPTADETQTMLSIRCRVKNEGHASARAHIRAKVNIQCERDVCDYHYVPFYWDATKWKPCDLVRLEGDQLLTSQGQIGRVVAGDCACTWEETAQFAEADYNKKFGYGAPYFVTPPLRLMRLDHTMHFEKDLAPDQEAECVVLLLTNIEGATESHRHALRAADAPRCRAAALAHFRSQLPAQPAELVFPTERWEDIFTACQLSTLQLLVKFPGENKLMPTQGGSSERNFVWVSEAFSMMLPMLALGHTEPVRRVLDYIFSLQDGGYPPEGRLASLAGAIGTTGPRWLNSTGSALVLAADYYLYTRDENYLREYLPKIKRAADWIARELRATRQLNPDGSRPLWYGLMPFGVGTDADVGYIVAYTDSYTYWGLSKTVNLLDAIGDARATEFRQLLNEYRGDLGHAIAGLTRPDGFIERAIRTGVADERIDAKFIQICNASHLAFCGAMSEQSAAFRKFTEYFEEHMADGLFLGKLDREVMYLGLAEGVWQEIYLRLGQWKKAFAAMRTNLRYGMTPDTWQVQERFSKTCPAFAPWQPNGSGNGRVLKMILNALYFEHDGVATLLGNIPFAWLRRNGTTALHNLRTPRGRLGLEVVMRDARSGTVRLTADPAEAMPGSIRFPMHLQAQTVSSGLRAVEGDAFAVARGAKAAEFVLTVGKQE